MKMKFTMAKETKNFILYTCPDSPFSKLYLSKDTMPQDVEISVE